MRFSRMAAVVAASGIAAVPLLGPASPASAGTSASPGGCAMGTTVPVLDPGGPVRATAWNNGCDTGWIASASLQSSRWYGWHDDVTVRLNGGQRKLLSAGCHGTHDYRVELTASLAGQLTRNKYSRTVTFRCAND